MTSNKNSYFGVSTNLKTSEFSRIPLFHQPSPQLIPTNFEIGGFAQGTNQWIAALKKPGNQRNHFLI